jgi:hypothetical protein
VPEELYDLSADPAEQNNLAASPQHGSTRTRLAGLLDAHMRATADPLLGAPFVRENGPG